MAKYSLSQYQCAFDYSDKVYCKEFDRKAAENVLVEKFGIALGTVRIFFECYRRMITGSVYKRALSKLATRVFLEGIAERHGSSALALAVSAAGLHAKYRAGKSDWVHEIIESFSVQLGNALTPLPGESFDSQLSEGEKIRVWVSRIERSAAARQRCIDHHGLCCAVCGFSFEATFGEIGLGFIHVHHLNPISNAVESYVIDPVIDLLPLCPNCHAMAHREDPPIPISRLRKIRDDHK